MRTEEQKAKRNVYQAKRRAEYIARGLTTAGKPRKQGLRQKYLDTHPEVFNPSQATESTNGRVSKKGYKKKPIPMDCPFYLPGGQKCDYHIDHPPAMARHIQTVHPSNWKGNLGESLGKEPSRQWKHLANQNKRETDLAKRREAYRKLADQNRSKGLTVKGEPFKDPGHANKHKPGRKRFKPIAYTPEQPDTEKTDQPILDRIISEAAKLLLSKLTNEKA